MDKTLSGMKDLTAAAKRKFKALALTTKTQLQEMLQSRLTLMMDINAHVIDPFIPSTKEPPHG